MTDAKVSEFTEKHEVDLRGIKVGEVLTAEQWGAVCAFVKEQDAIIYNLKEQLEAYESLENWGC